MADIHILEFGLHPEYANLLCLLEFLSHDTGVKLPMTIPFML